MGKPLLTLVSFEVLEGDRVELEFCAENSTLVERAIGLGATRVELCDNLAVGGTTPSYGVIKETVRLAHSRGVLVMVMIRPRGGSFEHDGRELAIMETDIAVADELGADGVVFGCLRDGWLGERENRRLLERARGMEVTFHMAFDDIPTMGDRLRAIEWLADHGVRRILTHGGVAGTSIEDNLSVLRAYVEYAAGRIGILPGGGVTHENMHHIGTALGVHEAHGTQIVPLGHQGATPWCPSMEGTDDEG